jgi:hypothetical protein
MLFRRVFAKLGDAPRWFGPMKIAPWEHNPSVVVLTERIQSCSKFFFEAEYTAKYRHTLVDIRDVRMLRITDKEDGIFKSVVMQFKTVGDELAFEAHRNDVDRLEKAFLDGKQVV